jgi:hypothetical protein
MSNQSHLAHAALSITLQHWMIPNLGWSTELYNSMFPEIRRTIIENRLQLEPNLCQDQGEKLHKQLEKQYETTFLYFDMVHCQRLKEKVNDLNAEYSLSKIKVSAKLYFLLKPKRFYY